MKRIIRFDMDGVLADFDGDYIARTGKSWADKAKLTKEEKWAALQPHPFFFRDLPWVHGAGAMYDFVRMAAGSTEFVPGIMSAASGEVPNSADHKRIWLARETPEIEEQYIEIVDNKRDKPQHARPGDILVDDYKVNVDAWIEAGGIGILFENARQAILELDEHMRTQRWFRNMALLETDRNGRMIV